MANRRREKTNKRLGLDSEKEKRRQEEALRKAEQRRLEQMAVRERIESSTLYKVLIKGAIVFDVADALMGLMEFAGDSLSFLVSMGYVVVSAKVVRSTRLTTAVFLVSLIDLLVGFIPGVGDLIDVIFCSSLINRSLIQGFVEGDSKAKRRVNIISIIGFAIVAGLVYLIVHIFRN